MKISLILLLASFHLCSCSKRSFSTEDLTFEVTTNIIQAKVKNNIIEPIFLNLSIFNNTQESIKLCFYDNELGWFNGRYGGNLDIKTTFNAKIIKSNYNINEEFKSFKEFEFEIPGDIRILKNDSFKFKLPLQFFLNYEDLRRGKYSIRLKIDTKTKVTSILNFTPLTKSHVTKKLKSLVYDNKLVSNVFEIIIE
ncbi:MAG: hypothetical protein COA79_26510 [Planctomycetota bacterium]|nr:MAG: hypothetical protein COA79_26510 [Planctomycetota bacterium]